MVQPVVHSDLRIPGAFPAFAYSLSFNSELSYNDGLLVSSIQKEQDISYNEANLRVNRFVEELNQKLYSQQEIFIPGVGKLQLSEGKIVFFPDDFLSCNAANYGLTDFFMPSLTDLIKAEQHSEEVPRPAEDVIWVPFRKSVFKTIGSAAAVALLFFVFSTPLSNYRHQTQSAAIVTLKTEEAKTMEALAKDSLSDSTFVDDALLKDSIQNISDSPVISEPDINKVAQDPKLNTRGYYIIIGSLPSLQMAQDQLKQIKTEFSYAEIVGDGDRFRIYVEKFSDKKMAESYLETFRNTRPAYKNAWLYSQKS